MEESAAQKEQGKKQHEEKEKNKAIMTAQKLASLEDSEKTECRTKSKF